MNAMQSRHFLSASRSGLNAGLRCNNRQVCRSSTLASSHYLDTSSASTSKVTIEDAPSAGSPRRDTSSTPMGLTSEQRNELEEMLRVDHSGEIAANTIYLAQSRMFNFLGDKATGKMCMDMLETEKKHLKVAEKLMAQHRIRPSAFNPVWSVAGSVLGGVTALFGKEGAMAATEAVETVIGEHYDDQVKLLEKIKEARRSDALQDYDPQLKPEDDSLELLSEIVKEFRDDELEHLDIAVEQDAQQAPAHALLSAVIGFGCKGAIRIAKRF